jgi:hypothetical protein
VPRESPRIGPAAFRPAERAFLLVWLTLRGGRA